METYAAYFAFLAGPLMFGALWSFALFVSSALGGWWKLSNRFRADGPARGEKLTMLNGRMRCFNYSFVLNAVVSERGVHLSVMFPFRPFHPPLFIPWESIRNLRRERIFFSRYAVFDVYGPEKLLTVRISESVLDLAHWKAHSI